MASLNEIKGISQDSLHLLEAAGIRNMRELAAQDADALLAELQRANEILSISKRPPVKQAVLEWISEARAIVGDPAPSVREPSVKEPSVKETAVPVPINYEEKPEVAEMLASAPCAIPLPGRILMEKGLGVSEIPAGLLLSQFHGDLNVRAEDSALPKTEVPARRDMASKERISKPAQRQQPVQRQQPAQRQQFDPSLAKPMPASVSETKRIPKSKTGDAEDRVALIRAPREETNRGKDPESRTYIRGVLHTNPWSLRIGAVFSLLLLLDLPLALLAALLLLLSREKPEIFPWVPEWLLAFPISLPLVGLGYLIWGMTGKCKICTQKLFAHKAALKHIKAHRLPCLGYVIPLAIHLLLFSWFRCSSCGTPVRLKK